MDRKRQDAGADVPSQIERFKEAARALGCDEDEAAFDEKLKVIAVGGRKPAHDDGAATSRPTPGKKRG